MSDPVLIALIIAAQGVAVATVNAITNARGRQQSKEEHLDTKASVMAVDEKVTENNKRIDGRMTELIVASKAKGAQDQRDEVRADVKQLREDARVDAQEAKETLIAQPGNKTVE